MMNKNRKAAFFLFIILHSSFIISSAGCGARRTPDLERIFAPARARTDKLPVIVIPGILGSQLMNRRTGEVVWPSAFRSSTDGLSLPTMPDLASNRDELVAERIVVTAKLARLAPDIYVYYELLNALRRFGNYRDGDWENPPPDGDRDTFYVFPYDWRRDNVESAQMLFRRVEELKRKLGRPDLRFNIVAHSMGGLVARYAAMYGDADLPAGDAAAPQPTWAGARHINKIFMFGTPNEGTMEAFATLLEGYSINEGLRRRVRLFNKLSREDAVTIPSIFQLLPHPEAVRFLDQNLRPLELDFYDPEVWRRYGWSPINNAEFRARYERGRVRDEEGAPQRATLAELRRRPHARTPFSRRARRTRARHAPRRVLHLRRRLRRDSERARHPARRKTRTLADAYRAARVARCGGAQDQTQRGNARDVRTGRRARHASLAPRRTSRRAAPQSHLQHAAPHRLRRLRLRPPQRPPKQQNPARQRAHTLD
jgi:hypothetical protein